MDLENKTLLLSMLSQESRYELEEDLTEDQKKEIFYFENFCMKQTTDAKPGEFIDNLVKEHYSHNNQNVPFDKIDDGYVQVIRNPYLKTGTGFIVVQVVARRYETTNWIDKDVDTDKNDVLTEDEKKINLN